MLRGPADPAAPLSEREPLYGSTRYRKVRDLNKCETRAALYLRITMPPCLYAASVATGLPSSIAHLCRRSQRHVGVCAARNGP